MRYKVTRDGPDAGHISKGMHRMAVLVSDAMKDLDKPTTWSCGEPLMQQQSVWSIWFWSSILLITIEVFVTKTNIVIAMVEMMRTMKDKDA